MRAALANFDSSMRMRKAAMNHGISYSTFLEWCYDIRKSWKRGPASVLSPKEEEQIVENTISLN
jgi:hypothetical protein